MAQQQETPFDNIDSALEYVTSLLEASREAREQVEGEILRAEGLHLTRKKEALLIISYKLDRLNSHVAISERLLKDLRKLRRLILEERETLVKSATA